MPEAKLTPAAQERAAELGIDPETIKGTGQGNPPRVTKEDVEKAAGPAAGSAEEQVKVKPHPEAGVQVVGPDGTAYRQGSTAPRSVLESFASEEMLHRPTRKYPEGYPLLIEMKEE